MHYISQSSLQKTTQQPLVFSSNKNVLLQMHLNLDLLKQIPNKPYQKYKRTFFPHIALISSSTIHLLDQNRLDYDQLDEILLENTLVFITKIHKDFRN